MHTTNKPIDTYLFFILTALIITLELLASKLSYENYDWITPIILKKMILLNLIPIILYLFKKKIIAILLVIILGIYIIPRQFLLTYELLNLKEEAANMVNYSYRYKLSTGKFPENINNYIFTHKKLKDKIKYTKYKDDTFMVEYFVGTENTDHFYQHSYPDGKWYYNDD